MLFNEYLFIIEYFKGKIVAYSLQQIWTITKNNKL